MKHKENGLKPCVDHKIKNHPRAEKLLSQSGRVSHEFHGQSSSTQGSGQNQKCHASPTQPDEEYCQEQWEKCGAGHNKSKSTWRPIREVLNVDNVLNELEQRRQQQQDSPRRSRPSTQERMHPEPSRGRDREFLRSRDDRRQKCLMTIYEDELRHETESHSSVESESKTNQQKCSKLRGGPKTLLHSETWTIQRTESGYESSDRLSSGSTNPDSPGVDGFASKEPRLTPEAQQQSQLHQKGGDAKSSPVSSSPSHNNKHQHRPQGKSHDQASHSHSKCSPSLRCKSKYSCSSSRKAVPSDHDSAGSEDRQSDQQELTNCKESTALRHMSKTSSSEWNSSDDLALSEPEDRESTYSSSNSPAIASDSLCPDITLPHQPACNVTEEPLQLSAAGSPRLRPAQQISPHKTGQTSHAPFRPRMLQEPFPSSPHLSSSSFVSPHRRSDTSDLRNFSDASSKSGSDPGRSTPSSCESEERPTGCRAEQTVPPQEVSLTTYFNVDNCMTETYRLKYHNQRPLVLSASVPRTMTERRESSHTLTADSQSQDVPKTRPKTSHNSNKLTAKWNPVGTKGLDERGFL